MDGIIFITGIVQYYFTLTVRAILAYCLIDVQILLVYV